jgi:hypothetical protein
MVVVRRGNVAIAKSSLRQVSVATPAKLLQRLMLAMSFATGAQAAL